MSTDTPRSQETTGTVTGPHDGRDRDGRIDHRYWRCERCGLETTDPRLREGCFRCGDDPPDAPESERTESEGSGTTREQSGRSDA